MKLLLTLIISSCAAVSSSGIALGDSNQGLSGTPNLVPPTSPECWKLAVSFLARESSPSTEQQLSGDHHVTMNQKQICLAMNEMQQKILALQIASCHMHDLGLDLYQEGSRCHEHHQLSSFSIEDDESAWSEGLSRSGDSFDSQEFDWHSCFKELSKPGVFVYTQFISHVQVLCTRLTAEAMLQHYHETQGDLLERHLQHSGIVAEHQNQINEWTQLHLANLREMSTTLPKQLQEQWVATLEQYAKDWTEGHVQDLVSRVHEDLQDQLQAVAQKHNDALHAAQQDMINHSTSWQLDLIASAQKQQELWNATAVEYQQQVRSQMEQHSIQVEALSGQLSSLRHCIEWLDHLWSMVQNSVNWVLSIHQPQIRDRFFLAFYVLFGNLFVWVRLTKRRRDHGLRGTFTSKQRCLILFIGLLGGALEEFLLRHYMSQDGMQLQLRHLPLTKLAGPAATPSPDGLISIGSYEIRAATWICQTGLCIAFCLVDKVSRWISSPVDKTAPSATPGSCHLIDDCGTKPMEPKLGRYIHQDLSPLQTSLKISHPAPPSDRRVPRTPYPSPTTTEPRNNEPNDHIRIGSAGPPINTGPKSAPPPHTDQVKPHMTNQGQPTVENSYSATADHAHSYSATADHAQSTGGHTESVPSNDSTVMFSSPIPAATAPPPNTPSPSTGQKRCLSSQSEVATGNSDQKRQRVAEFDPTVKGISGDDCVAQDAVMKDADGDNSQSKADV